jgi:hypothetical protein
MSAQPPPGHKVGSKLAQLLGEVIIHHAPVTAGINAQATTEAVNQWLEGLEQHSSALITPFLQKILDESDPPPEIRGLIEEAINPQAQFSSTLIQIFVWGVVSNIIGTSVGPFLQAVSNQLSANAVAAGIAKPTDPATIATAVGRGLNLGDPPTVTVPQWAYDQAAENLISKEDVDLAASIIGLPPAMQELFEMQRRGIITSDQVAQGLREGDFRDDWIQYAQQLIHTWLTPLDFVRAAVQAQMSYDDARTWAESTGLDVTTAVPIETGSTEATPDMFGLAYAIAGRPPGPQELARMALRGIIEWEGTGADALTFQQGIAESDVKTKWTDALQALSQYVPPPREVGTLLERGAITSDQAVQFWQEGGVPAALAQGYAYMAEQQHVGQDKLLALGEVKTGYFDGIFTNAQATDLLGDLGYRGAVATEILALVDFRREIQAINSVVRRIGTLFEGGKLSPTDAQNGLLAVGISAEQATNLLSTWATFRQEPFHLPTAAEIGAAVKYNTLTQAEAITELAALGYQPRDAAIVLSAHAEQQVTPLPASGTGVGG